METDFMLTLFMICGVLVSFAVLVPRSVGRSTKNGYDLPIEPVRAPVGSGCFPAIVVIMVLFVGMLVVLGA